MFFISKSSQRTSMAARTSMCTARAVASARKSRKAAFVQNRIRLLERRIEIDIHAPSFIAVGEIEGHQELRCGSGDETGAITCVKTVPAEVAGLGGDLSRVDKETPVEFTPDAISVFEPETKCAFVAESVVFKSAQRFPRSNHRHVEKRDPAAALFLIGFGHTSESDHLVTVLAYRKEPLEVELVFPIGKVSLADCFVETHLRKFQASTSRPVRVVPGVMFDR